MQNRSRPRNLNSYFENLVGNIYCCIRYHFLGRISFRLGTAGWYCVTKGKIRFFVLFRWRRAGVLSRNFSSENVVNEVLRIASLYKVFFKCGNVFFKFFV